MVEAEEAVVSRILKEIRVSNPQTFGPPGILTCDELIQRTSAWEEPVRNVTCSGTKVQSQKREVKKGFENVLFLWFVLGLVFCLFGFGGFVWLGFFGGCLFFFPERRTSEQCCVPTVLYMKTSR